MEAIMSMHLRATTGARMHWLLLGSLALNIAFVGAAGAVAYRYSTPAPLANVSRIEHSLPIRLNQIAARLPATDAQLIRDELRAEEEKIAVAQADLRLSQEEVRNSLRADPFDARAMRTAMANSRAARENFDQVLHDMIATAAAKMSPVGRTRLADWRPRETPQPVQ
jgi:uncharacterized membrane protein